MKISRSTLAELLSHKYPDHKWDLYLLKGKYAQQKRLERAVLALFPVSSYFSALLDLTSPPPSNLLTIEYRD